MNKLNSLKDFSFEKNDNSEGGGSNKEIDKVLCNHCGRTTKNGIRCLGICVADNDY